MAIQSFTAGQVLTAAQMNSLQANDYNQTVSTKTVSYTLVAADKGTRVVMNAAGATTITVNTSVFSAGDTVVLQNIGAGVCTVTAGTATVSSAGPLAIPQYGSGTLYFTSAGVSIYFPSAVTVAVPSSGMTLIQAETSTTAATATYSNVFSATYAIYKVFIVVTAADTTRLQFRFAAGGTADTSSSYTYTVYGGDGTTDTTAYYQRSSAATPQDKIILIQNLNGNGQVELTVQNPYQSKVSRLLSSAKGYYGGGTNYAMSGGGLFDATTSFDGFQLFNSGGSTFTYATTIYGLALS